MIKLNTIFKMTIICHLILLQLSVALSKSQSRIVNGTPTTIDKAQSLVQIHVDGQLSCGGTLITDQYVVTAAHCVTDTTPDRIVVVGGASKVTDFGVRSKVTKIIVPREYNAKTIDYDVAVMKLKTPLTGPSVKPASLYTEPIKQGDLMQVFGWGLMFEKAVDVPTQLQTVTVEVIGQDKCTADYSGRRSITNTMFCAAAPGKDACSGDSGGPGMIKGKLAGIVSWGIGCGRSGSPGVYTYVSKVWSFVTAAIKS